MYYLPLAKQLLSFLRSLGVLLLDVLEEIHKLAVALSRRQCSTHSTRSHTRRRGRRSTRLEYRSHSTAVNYPGGMIVDLGPGARRPDEDLQREAMILAFIAMSHVPVFFCASCLLQEEKDLNLKEGGILHKMSQEGSGLLQG
jgi:hypothetical protein